MRAFGVLAAIVVLLVPAMASADIIWSLGKDKGKPYLEAMSDESEVDTDFWARCNAANAIEVGIGAYSNVGDGKGEKVALTLTSGGTSASLNGLSRESVNVEMTGGTELRATVKRDDVLFKVLATGKPIAVSGSIEPTTWPVKGLKAKVAAFLKACK